MGFSTVTATRIFEGQQRGVDGEFNVLAWEAFPHLAASKTYSSDAQITDSAPSAVAMTTGVKTINDVMGLDHTADAGKLRRSEDQGGDHAVGVGGDHRHVDRRHHHGAADPRNAGCRLFAHRQPRLGIRRGMPPEAVAAGAPTSRGSWSRCATATASRSRWAAAAATSSRRRRPTPRTRARPASVRTARTSPRPGSTAIATPAPIVWNKEQFDAIDAAQTDHLLGLFEMSHMEYDYDRPKDTAGEPSLAEMTEKTIDILSQQPGRLPADDRGRPHRPRQP